MSQIKRQCVGIELVQAPVNITYSHYDVLMHVRHVTIRIYSAYQRAWGFLLSQETFPPMQNCNGHKSLPND